MYLSKNRPRRSQAEVRKETDRGKDRFKLRGHFADERRSRAILNFLTAMGVGCRMPDMAWGGGGGEGVLSEASERELRERRERRGGGWRAEEPGVGVGKRLPFSPPRLPSRIQRKRFKG